MRKVIRVTQEHIDAAIASESYGQGNSCPVYRAAEEVFNEPIWVEKNRIVINTPGFIFPDNHHREIKLPQIAIDKIIKFDNHEPIEPFKFAIDIPDR